MKRFFIVVALLCSAAAFAQTPYPDKPVRFIVAFAPGGPADIIARLIGQKLGDAWAQSVVIENRPGAGGNIATRLVAKAAADGYTILVNTSAFAVNPSLSKDAGYDPERDFIPVVLIASSPNLIVAAPSLKAETLRDVIALGKAGTRLNYGSAGAGTTPHLSAEYLFRVLANTPVVHVPFTGAGPALNAAMGGQVELASVAMPAAVSMVKSGKVKGLVVTSSRRVSVLPEVPTVAESGFPGFEDYTWVALFLPAGTPGPISARINASVNAVLATPDTRERLDALGFEPMGGSMQEFNRYLGDELRKWAKVVRETGAKGE